MKSLYAALLVGGSVLGTSGVVLAHHSFAMFDQEHPIQLVGTVKEYRYTSPHTFIILDVKGTDGTSQLWNLEGGAPVDEFLEWFPGVTREQVDLVLRHAEQSLAA